MCLVYAYLVGLKTVRNIYVTYYGRTYQNFRKIFQNSQRPKEFWSFQAFVLSYIQLIQKEGNDEKFRKPHIFGK